LRRYLIADFNPAIPAVIDRRYTGPAAVPAVRF
jgi:hypothetical protein